MTKNELRVEARRRRAEQPDKDAISHDIFARVRSLPEYAAARIVLFYVGVRDEVSTSDALSEELRTGKAIAVPWCNEDGGLDMYRIESPDELEPGRFAIPEPAADVRDRPERRLVPSTPDLLLVPGLAFDRRGGRLGYGKGYYDRLLAEVRPDAAVVGLALECQMFDAVPTDPHDRFVDLVVTEAAIYRTQR